jgi:hypothetical protein
LEPVDSSVEFDVTEYGLDHSLPFSVESTTEVGSEYAAHEDWHSAVPSRSGSGAAFSPISVGWDQHLRAAADDVFDLLLVPVMLACSAAGPGTCPSRFTASSPTFASVTHHERARRKEVRPRSGARARRARAGALPAHHELVALLTLHGDETVIDYGAGTGRLARAVAEALTPGGQVIAVDENPEIFERLAEQLADVDRARPLHITNNNVPLADGSAQRILAVNLLHEVRGELALAEMRRLLAPGGFVLVVDWERGRERDSGPPDELLYTADEAAHELQITGLSTEVLDARLPFHFVIKATA